VRIQLATVFVDDQDKALAFYTDVLGFVRKTEIPLGGGDGAGIRTGLPSRGQAVQGSAGRRRDPVHLLRDH